MRQHSLWLVLAACFTAVVACSTSDAGDGDAAAGGETIAGSTSDPEGGAPGSVGGTTASDGGTTAEGLCTAVDLEAVALVMGEALSVQTDTELLCKLQSTGSASFVVQRVLTGGSQRYEQKLALLGSEEEFDDVGDRAFRSGYMYGVQLGDQYVEFTFATSERLDADARLESVRDILGNL